MNDIYRVLRAAAWRLGVIGFIRNLVIALAVLLSGAMVLRIVEQVFAFTDPAVKAGEVTASDRLSSDVLWQQFAMWGGIGCVAIALLWTLFTLAGRRTVARRVDEGANLKESLSTALYIERAPDPWSRATVESAAQKARGVLLRQAVPIQAPRFWPVPLALALTFVVLYIAMPRLDVLGWFKEATAKQEQAKQVVEVKQQAAEATKKIDEMMKKLGLDDAKPEEPEALNPAPLDPEAIRKSALKSITKRSEELQKLMDSEKGAKMDAIKEKLQQLQARGQLKELTKALSAGNFEQAKAELMKMKEQMASGNMSEADKKKVGEQLEKLAKQMDNLAKDKKDLENKLEKAGLDKKLAGDQKALEEALKNDKNLSEEQKEQLKTQCESQSQCQSAMEGMSQQMSKAAEGMKSGDQGEQQEGMEGAGQMMSEMEQLAAEMELADAAMSECKSAMAGLGKCDKSGMGECDGNGLGESNKPWASGIPQSNGQGRGGPGFADGGTSFESPADFDKEKRKHVGLKGDSNRIVGSRLVEGDSIRGESKAAFSEAVATADQGASDAIEQNTIPREYHDAVKTYFGRLKARTQANERAPATPADAKPADEKKDK